MFLKTVTCWMFFTLFCGDNSHQYISNLKIAQKNSTSVYLQVPINLGELEPNLEFYKFDRSKDSIEIHGRIMFNVFDTSDLFLSKFHLVDMKLISGRRRLSDLKFESADTLASGYLGDTINFSIARRKDSYVFLCYSRSNHGYCYYFKK